MNKLFFGIFGASIFCVALVAPPGCAQVMPPPQSNVPHNKIYQTGWLPEAKTPAEFQAYMRAAAVEGGASAEKAAGQFAIEYPESTLRYLLYSRVMKLYQEANDPDGVVKNGRLVLELHPDDPVALAMTATMLAEHTSESDPNREARLTEALGDGRRAINNIDTALIVPPHTPEVQIQQAKNFLLSSAHSAIGLVELKRGHDGEAEREFKASLDAGKADPSPLTWLRLAIAQEHEKDYSAALASADHALQAANPNSQVSSLARQERERLLHLTGSAAMPTPAEK